jgi:hypothetical protein
VVADADEQLNLQVVARTNDWATVLNSQTMKQAEFYRLVYPEIDAGKFYFEYQRQYDTYP